MPSCWNDRTGTAGCQTAPESDPAPPAYFVESGADVTGCPGRIDRLSSLNVSVGLYWSRPVVDDPCRPNRELLILEEGGHGLGVAGGGSTLDRFDQRGDLCFCRAAYRT